jgi:hypothetical protein
MRRRLLISARSVLLGWAALFAITYLVENPLLRLMARPLGASWVPTAQLVLACSGLAATGWVIVRWNNLDAKAALLGFAATLAVWNFGLLPIDLPWLFHLLIDSFENSRYLESFFNSFATHAFLFGSLFIGARLHRTPGQGELRIFPSGG